MRFGFTLRFDGRYSSYRNEFHLYSASCYCILLHHEVGNTDYYQRCRPWCILLYGFRVLTDQGGKGTYVANATSWKGTLPLSLSARYFGYAFTDNRYSVSTTARYATETMFLSDDAGKIEVKLYGVGSNGAATFPSANTDLKFIAIGK